MVDTVLLRLLKLLVPIPTSYLLLQGLLLTRLGVLTSVLPCLSILLSMGVPSLLMVPIDLTPLKCLFPLIALFILGSLRKMTLFSRLTVKVSTFMAMTLLLLLM